MWSLATGNSTKWNIADDCLLQIVWSEAYRWSWYIHKLLSHLDSPNIRGNSDLGNWVELMWSAKHIGGHCLMSAGQIWHREIVNTKRNNWVEPSTWLTHVCTMLQETIGTTLQTTIGECSDLWFALVSKRRKVQCCSASSDRCFRCFKYEYNWSSWSTLWLVDSRLGEMITHQVEQSDHVSMPV